MALSNGSDSGSGDNHSDSVYAIDNSTHRARNFADEHGQVKKKKTYHCPALLLNNSTIELNSPKSDLISSLPDCVLSAIISRLPTKDAARTTIVSSRWRHLWSFALLNLDTYCLSSGGNRPSYSKDSCAFKDIISCVLKKHCGQVRRFRIAHVCFGGSELCLREWLTVATKVEETWRLISNANTSIIILQVERSAIQAAHTLANWARAQKQSLSGVDA